MGDGGIAPPFLTSELDVGKLSASHPVRFISGERVHDTRCIVGCGAPEPVMYYTYFVILY
jgi:hypothetical protein